MKQMGLACLVAVVTSLGAASASADVVYNYVGNDFTYVRGAYSTSDKVTGSITVSAPLAPFTIVSVAGRGIPSYSFSDGHQTINSSNYTNETLVVETDATGSINYWNIILSNAVGRIVSGSYNLDQGFLGTASVDLGHNISSPGVWTLQVAAVPEPSTWAMMILGFCGLGFMAYRRKALVAA